jgi:hypothetical protein
MFLPTGVINGHDRSPVKEKHDEHEHNRDGKEYDAGTWCFAGEDKRTASKKAKPARKAGRAKKTATKPKAGRGNKKVEVVTMLKRAKGATLAEIMAATKWQAHTVRGFVSILGSKGGEKIESSKNAAGERTYKIAR